MKTKSIKAIAALFSVAAILNVSAVAGPDPQQLTVPKNATEKKVSTVAVTAKGQSVATRQATKESEPKFERISGAHGDIYLYR
jgi:hypothetical protein